MRKLIQAEVGEFEHRYTAFVATDVEAALRYVQESIPNVEWEIIDFIHTFPPGPDQPEPYRVWNISPKSAKSLDIYDLSEIDFAE